MQALPLTVALDSDEPLRTLAAATSIVTVSPSLTGLPLGSVQMWVSVPSPMSGAAATAICGPIGFVGLVVPHACRLIAGVDHRLLLPLSALGGAVLLTLADVLGRFLARPGELEAGVVTAFIGAPVFIAIVRRKRIREL